MLMPAQNLTAKLDCHNWYVDRVTDCNVSENDIDLSWIGLVSSDSHLKPIVSITSASSLLSEIRARKKYNASSLAVPVGRGIDSSKVRTPLDGSSKHTSSSLLDVSEE